jgi:hypothetical protein
MIVARKFDCQFACTSHASLGRQERVREEALPAVRNRKAPQGLTEEEAQLYISPLEGQVSVPAQKANHNVSKCHLRDRGFLMSLTSSFPG